MTVRERKLLELATKLELTCEQASILPAAFDKMSQMAGMLDYEMFEALMKCQELADYLKTVIAKVADGIALETQTSGMIQRLK